ncbi:dockerin type I domain-containing protein [Ruminococcus flavefaciens]|uniref:dockerin type I domain-containing protein n=1 Tax=Ruminococcus flavefaciens TaxID=1265 RepID=UPI000463EC5A|nr:dockerin type I domain-containing protein [Ruminococcus flavefaciens]
MMIKKILAAVSAVAIMGTSAAYNGVQFSLFRSYAAGTEEQVTEGGVMISVIAPGCKLPEGLNAKLVEVRGEEKTVLSEWDPASTDIQTISKLSLSDDVSYKLIIGNIPKNYYLPEETDIILENSEHTDKIVICGFDISTYPGTGSSFVKTKEPQFTRRLLSFGSNSKSLSSAFDKDLIEEAYIKDDKGFRYINAFSDSKSSLVLPDGHYTAYVKPANGYRFVKHNSEGELAVISLSSMTSDWYADHAADYFDHDFSKGIGFNVKDGESDRRTEFYIEKVPTAENSCSAAISVIDEDTGKPLEGCVIRLKDDSLSSPSLTWITGEQPMEFDDLRSLDKTYEVDVKYLPAYYKSETDHSLSFSEFGEHKDIVIKAKRTVSEEEAAKLKKAELPKEDPVPVDSKHCAVTIAAYDLNTFLPPKKLTALLIKRANDESKTKTELASWNVGEEPVKTFTDIEFDPNATYYLSFPMEMNSYNNDGSIELDFKKGGDTDKIAVPLYESYMYGNVDADCCICTQKDSATSYGSVYNYSSKDFPLASYGIYDDNGYRYCYASGLASYQLGLGALPDGEYTFRVTPKDGYRILQKGSEYMCVSSLREKFSLEALEQNYEKSVNGIRFKVENGLLKEKVIILIEEAPTAETACSANISVVDEASGEPVNDVKLKFVCSKNSSYSYSWNTTDVPVMKYDNLLYLNSKYKVSVKGAPEGYEYSDQSYEFSFTEYGQNEDLVIKLKKNDPLGDVNSDGRINAVDASTVLTYYANVSTNKEGGFTDAQVKAADIDKNDTINAVDASHILSYYAYTSTAKEDIMPIEDYLKNY